MDMTISVMQADPDVDVTDIKVEANPMFTNVYAPIGEGTVIGSVAYVYNGKTLASANLLAERSVKEGNAQTGIAPVEVDSSDSSPAAITGELIGDANAVSLNPDDVIPVKESGGCGLPDNMKWLPIVLAVIFVLLIVCVVLFILYLRAEQKRRRAAARRRARQRARASGQYNDRQ